MTLAHHQARLRLRSIFLIVNLVVVLLPLGSIFFFRIYENMLVRQTELELISQAAVLAETYKQKISQTLSATANSYGQPLPHADSPRDAYYTPVDPMIDLADAPLLPPRPDGERGKEADSTAVALGDSFTPLLHDIRKATLAGAMLLDYHGIAVSGYIDKGLSFTHLPEVQEALNGKYRAVLRKRISNEPAPAIASISRGTGIRIFAAYPIMQNKQLWGVVYLSRTPQNILKHLHAEKNKVILAGAVIIGITLFLTLFTTYMVSRPINCLIKRTQQVSSGETAIMEPLNRPATKEVEQLGESFAAMTRTLHERSEYIRNFATHVSHEFKTPLTSIQGASELLLEHIDDMASNERQKFLSNIMEDTERLKHLVNRLLELARADSLTPSKHERTRLAPVLEKLQSRYRDTLELTVNTQLDDTIPISADNLLTILVNLLDNAQQHGASKVTIRVKNSEDFVVTVSDNGSGISPANRNKIFTPFFTTKRESGGTGIGLGIAQSLMEAHNGQIALIDSNQGAAFELRFRN